MKRWSSLGSCLAMLALLALPSPALAQKTVKACQDEWRANKADNQAKGITEKAFVAKCRAGEPSAQPASAPAAKQSPAPAAKSAAPSEARSAPAKTAKVCQDEWRANKAAYQAAKITERAYVTKCRAGEAVALPNAPAAAPTPAPTAATPAAPTPAPTATTPAAPPPARTATTPAAPPPPRTATTPATPVPAPPSASTAKPAPVVAKPPTGADQFQTETQAKLHCPSDLVVWVNLSSKIYHFAGARSYGTTKSGAYMCEKEATGHGFRASKTEKRPGA